MKAFPRPYSETSHSISQDQDGMDLIDWFAGMALTGVVSQENWSPKDAAAEAWEIADAMMAEREKRAR